MYYRFVIISSFYGVCVWVNVVIKEFLKFRYLVLFILKIIFIIIVNDNVNYFIFNIYLFGLKLELILMLF